MPDLNTFLSRLLYSRLPLIGGSGGSASGVLTVNTTEASTIADTNETDLWTYSLPANTLAVNGRVVRVTVWGTTAANANNKLPKLYFDNTVVNQWTTAQALNSGSWRITMDVVRTGASAQTISSFDEVRASGISVVNVLTVSETADTAAAITIKVTGQNGTASAGDITFKCAIVELLN